MRQESTNTISQAVFTLACALLAASTNWWWVFPEDKPFAIGVFAAATFALVCAGNLKRVSVARLADLAVVGLLGGSIHVFTLAATRSHVVDVRAAKEAVDIPSAPVELPPREECRSDLEDCTFLASTLDGVYRIDPYKSEITEYAPGGIKIYDIATTPAGTLYAVGSGKLWRFNAIEGEWIPLADSRANGLCADQNGQLYATLGSQFGMLQLDGTLTNVQTLSGQSDGDCVMDAEGPLATVSVAGFHGEKWANVTRPGSSTSNEIRRGRNGGSVRYVLGLAAVGKRQLIFGVKRNGELLRFHGPPGQSSSIHEFKGYSFTGAAKYRMRPE